ncbi:EamA family transporter [Sneathiella sp. P13V-1]|uniref:DMT family transporter n=1 Tax=Sneathiella sp. P13V-1 TaxID=2697366 RepID=UPI00187B423C|nr:DMT family transporter [Sneathiella sp. P13V-1]MBE7636240.1 EamA family transporter [Sneathiella sp. P13V-1]
MSNRITIPGLGTNGHAYLFLTCTMLFWGCNAVFSRLAVGEVSPLTLVTLRWAVVISMVFVIARKNVKRDWPKLKPRLGYFMIMGATGFTGFNAMFYIAAHSTTALNIGIIQGAMPVIVLLGSFILFRTPVTISQMLGVAVTLIGVAVVTSAGSLDTLLSLSFNDGDILILIAALVYGVYTIALRFKPDVSALSFFAVLAFAAFLTCLPLLAYEIYSGQAQMPTPTGWALILAIAILPSFLAQLLFINGVTLIGPGRAGIFINLVPIFAAILAVLFLSEDFEIYHGAALVLVLGGIWLAERGKKAGAS